jgi:molybdopterin synthase catalytic subunit
VKVDLREAPIGVDEAVAHVARPGAGAISVFVGVVRDENDGKPVARLEYSAYGSIARRQMETIATEIERDVEGAVVCALHRTGSLAVGDAAVVCVASAPHRDEAFRACRLLIDRIKERVPIWKRELGPDGSASWTGWVDARCTGDEHAGHAHAHDHDRHGADRGDRADRAGGSGSGSGGGVPP